MTRIPGGSSATVLAIVVSSFNRKKNTRKIYLSEQYWGYDLICIHPNPRYHPKAKQKAQIRIQVKSRYATDCDRGFPVKEQSIDAFDFLIIVFMNIGKFFGKNTGSEGSAPVEFYTLPAKFVREHHNKSSSWQKVRLRGLENEIKLFAGEQGFEQITEALGIERPRKIRATHIFEPNQSNEIEDEYEFDGNTTEEDKRDTDLSIDHRAAVFNEKRDGMLSFEEKRTIFNSFEELTEKPSTQGRYSYHYYRSRKQKTHLGTLTPSKNGNGYVWGKFLSGYPLDPRGWIKITFFTSEELNKLIREAIESFG